MKKYQIIGGQYNYINYGESDKLIGAKQIAAKHDEYWDNWQGWHRPKIYETSVCTEVDGVFYPDPDKTDGNYKTWTYNHKLKHWEN